MAGWAGDGGCLRLSIQVWFISQVAMRTAKICGHIHCVTDGMMLWSAGAMAWHRTGVSACQWNSVDIAETPSLDKLGRMLYRALQRSNNHHLSATRSPHP